MNLLRREDDLMGSILRESNGATSVTDKYGEGWGEYYASLVDACFQYCNRQAFLDETFRLERSDRPEARNDAVRALGHLALPNRGFSNAQRTVIENHLIADARDDDRDIRSLSVTYLAKLAHEDPHLPSSVRVQIHEVVVVAVADRSAMVREQAVRALGDIGDAGDLALLQRLSETDTARSIQRGVTVFPVRDQARQAMAKIKP